MSRLLFGDICPAAYALAVKKNRFIRSMQDIFSSTPFAKNRGENLPVVVYRHNSLIRRKLGDVDGQLQENKAVNLSLAAHHINGILIKPGETFSFWKLVGNCTRAKGYLEGLTLAKGLPSSGIGGGLCQFTNLLHWLVLHSPLTISEHHQHDEVDLFPDFDRQVPFGIGTSISYNYLDYRVKNNTGQIYQFVVFLTATHLCGELRTSAPWKYQYHIGERDQHFIKLGNSYYRRNKIYKITVNGLTGREVSCSLIKENHARVLYGEEFINPNLIRVEGQGPVES